MQEKNLATQSLFLTFLSLVAVCLVFIPSTLRAQGQLTPFEKQGWYSDPSLFLEPNHFSIDKELDDRSLWLEVGFGRPVMLVGSAYVGLEALAWSRLQSLSDFRFPVETVDYFFGAYLVKQMGSARYRLRVSHISSHDVDGKDTVVGGSSSHYSREFAELDCEGSFGRRQGLYGEYDAFTYSIGIRGFFHQVSRFEPALAIPASMDWIIGRHTSTNGEDYSVHMFVSSGAGPTSPSLSGGLRGAYKTRSDNFAMGERNIQIFYQYGASWSGTDAGAKRTSINLQLDIRGL